MPEHRNQKGKIIVLVAPSGAGKSTLSKMLLKDFDNLSFSVSATSRKPRSGEKNGVDYYFLSSEEFQHNIDQGNFLEWEEFYGGTRYGTLFSEVEKRHNSGYFTLLDIEVNGALNVKEKYGDDCLTVFIKPPSLEILEERLRKRGTEDEHSLKLRLERAKHELKLEHEFDSVIINDDIKQAYRELKQLVQPFTEPLSKG